MALDLQGRQWLRTKPDRLVKHGDVEIGDADVTREAVPLCLGERAHGFGKRGVLLRPMNEQQIDIVDAKRTEALFDRADEVGGMKILVRDLGADKDLAARHA